jgi:hypothetical protein
MASVDDELCPKRKLVCDLLHMVCTKVG